MIQAGATIGWQKSASLLQTYEVKLNPGQKGYMGFKPYYNKVVGNLELYGNWGDGLLHTEYGVAGYSVKLTSIGQADGEFTLVLK